MHRKKVLVTGSSRGIGRACALAFAQAGYHVFINCRKSLDRLDSLEQEILTLGGTCTKVPGDAGNPDEVRAIFRVISETIASSSAGAPGVPGVPGGLDVLVNNAGISHFGLLSDMSDEEWRTMMDTNLSSAFYCCREAVPYMVSRKQGRIINISSMWGVAGASCEAAYSASKAPDPGAGKGACPEQCPGERHCLRRDRHRDECPAGRRRAERTERRDPGRPFRHARRGGRTHPHARRSPRISHRADHPHGRRSDLKCFTISTLILSHSIDQIYLGEYL